MAGARQRAEGVVTEPAKILFVDDEPNLLAAMERNFGLDYDVATATSGADALVILRVQGPFAVVVSDMRMPQMSGAEFLARARHEAPDTVRMLLTGQSELESAIAAVNQGAIFRFLTKPCQRDDLHHALEAAIEQHQLRAAERVLLEQTLAGATGVLTDVLAMVAPEIFKRTRQIREIAIQLARATEFPRPWVVDLAAAFSYLGMITLPEDLLHKVYAGTRLTESEREAYSAHPATAARLIGAIPRLQEVAAIIRHQRGGAERDETVVVRDGAALLHLAIEIDGMLWRGVAPADIARTLRDRKVDPRIVEAIGAIAPADEGAVRRVKVAELRPGMIIERDIVGKNGVLVIAHGTQLSSPLIERLHRFRDMGTVAEPIVVKGAAAP
jgi:response regulator RpfG family c-di-GMP phosphodiesterase